MHDKLTVHWVRTKGTLTKVDCLDEVAEVRRVMMFTRQRDFVVVCLVYIVRAIKLEDLKERGFVGGPFIVDWLAYTIQDIILIIIIIVPVATIKIWHNPASLVAPCAPCYVISISFCGRHSINCQQQCLCLSPSEPVAHLAWRWQTTKLSAAFINSSRVRRPLRALRSNRTNATNICGG